MTAITTTSQPTTAQFYLAQEEHARDLAELNRLRAVNVELVVVMQALLHDHQHADPHHEHLCALCNRTTAVLDKSEAK